ncbi:MAG: hypothetical protein Q8P15_03580 [Nanoarchaeota archaeon]|nr:hypothetical protein [Nanoarchaeota archaeon]
MEKRTIQYDNKNILVAILVAVLVVLLATLISLIFNLSVVQAITMSWILTTFYSLFAFFIIDNKEIIQIESERIIEKPIEVIREFIPFENQEIREVPAYIPETIIRRKPLFKKYDYVASSETKTYHKKNCRFGKLIKKKYKMFNNDYLFFNKKDFKACKICLKEHKKI